MVVKKSFSVFCPHNHFSQHAHRQSYLNETGFRAIYFVKAGEDVGAQGWKMNEAG
jgi:hypothetical protein